MKRLDEWGMFDDFSIRGTWFLPESPDDTVPGELTFSQSKVRLSLDRCFKGLETRNLWPFGSDAGFKQPLIFGIARSGENITLRRCAITHVSEHCEFTYNELLIGAHVEDDAKDQVHSFLADLTHLTEWAFAPQFHMQYNQETERTEISFKNEPIDMLHVEFAFPFKQMKVSAGIEQHLRINDFHLKARASVYGEFESSMSISEARRTFDLLQNLFSLFVGEVVQAKKLRLVIVKDSQEIPIDVFGRFQQHRVHRESWTDMTIPLNDFRDQLPALISRWFSDETKLRPVYNLLFGTIHRPDQYVQSIYLSLMQGVESFHRLAYGGHYELKEQYDKLKIALLCALPAETSKGLKEKLKMTLEHANQYSLRKRLRELFKILGPTAVALLLGRESKEEFIGKIVDLRNYLTHYDESSALNIVSLANDLIEMYNLNRKLRAFLAGLLLTYLGLDQQHVNKLFSVKNLGLAQ